jgi:RNA polymerase sigma-70 factor, ECF subfamily
MASVEKPGAPAKNPTLEPERIAAAQEDPQAFSELYAAYVRPMFRFMYNRVGSAEEAQELTAAVFLAAVESLPRYNHRGNFAAWLFSIARRKVSDYYRRRPPLPLDAVHNLPGEDDIALLVSRRDEIRRMRERIAALDGDEREWIHLHFAAELTYAEMAALLGKNEEAVKKAMQRLLSRLRDSLEQP